jgi:hypothetical protein
MRAGSGALRTRTRKGSSMTQQVFISHAARHVSDGTNITSFNLTTGSVNWNYQAASQSSLSLIS